MGEINIGCIYDLTTKERIALIVNDDGSPSYLEPHKANVKEGQGWLVIPSELYNVGGSNLENYNSSIEVIDAYIKDNT